MRLMWMLLPILVSGAAAELFKVQPQAEFVVHQGDEATLQCVTNSPVSLCAWKINAPELGLTGLLTNDIPGTVDITARDSASKTDCTITLNNLDDRYNGEYICSPFSSSGQEDARPSRVIIARKPASLGFLGEAASGFPLAASSAEPTVVQCQAGDARPKAEIVWYLGNTQLYDGVEVEDSEPNEAGMVTSVSTLTYQFHKEDNGLSLRCRANHAGYDEADEQLREKSVDVDVQYAAYRPEGNNIGKIYGFTAGQKDDITVNFTANPRPTIMSWRVGDSVNVPVGGQSLDGRFTAGGLDIRNASLGLYSLTLTIDPVELEDQSKVFKLRLENVVGASELEFSIGTGAAPPPAALGGATIAGIVVAVLVLLLIIGLVAFGRSRGKWCFAGKDAVDRPAKPRPLKARRPSAAPPAAAGDGGDGGDGGDAGRRRASVGSNGRRGSRGGSKWGVPMSLAALKQSMSARPNRQRLNTDDASVEVGREEVTYVNHAPPAGSAVDEVELKQELQTLVKKPVSTPAPVEPPPPDTPASPTPVDIPELEAPPRPVGPSAGGPVNCDLNAMPGTPPTPISPIRFPTTRPGFPRDQPPAAVSSPVSSELDSPKSSRPGQTRVAQGEPTLSTQDRPGSGQVYPPSSSQPGSHERMADRRANQVGPGMYSNTGPALPDRNSVPRWPQPAVGRQRGAVALPDDSGRYPPAPTVDLPLAGSREELGIPYPPAGGAVRPRGPPLPPKNRPKSQVPAGAVRVFPGVLEQSAHYPSSPSLLDPDGEGSAV